MYLFFDTETTGLPKKWDAPLKDLNNWPRLVQLAWLEFDKDGNQISSGDYIVKPSGFEIPEEAARIHKITTQDAINKGYKLKDVLNVFNSIVTKSTYLVAHNIAFDEKILGAEFLREYVKTDFNEKKQVCTMESTVDFMKLPAAKGGYRFPGLSDLYRKIFGEGFSESHNAFADIQATAKIFWELEKQGVIDPDNPIKAKNQEEESKQDDQSFSLF
jgi:DNA polymerase III epsilon subunit-like protein